MRKMKFLKGMGTGLLVGLCVGMTVAADRKRARRLFNSTAKTVSGIIDDISDAMGF
jgi:gas vesicle protein